MYAVMEAENIIGKDKVVGVSGGGGGGGVLGVCSFVCDRHML